MSIQVKIIRLRIKSTLCRVLDVILNIVGFLLFWIRPKTFEKEKIKSILIIKLERIGDLVLSTPAIRALRNEFPESPITVVVNLYTRPIIENDPVLDEVLVYEKAWSLLKKINFIRKLRKESFDLAIDLGTRDLSFFSVLLTALSGAKISMGLNNFGRAFLCNYKIKPNKTPLPYAQEVLNILQPLNLSSQSIQPELFTSKENAEYIDKFLNEKNIKKSDVVVGIHPGGYFETLRWTKEGYFKITQYLIEKYNAKVFFVGNSKETELITGVISSISDKVFNVAGQLTLGQTMALISKSCLFMGGSSGPLNIALGFDIPSVSFLGPSIPERWWPQGDKHIVLRKDLECSPCRSGYCLRKDFLCMRSITIEEVRESVDKQLGGSRKDNAGGQ